MRHQGAVARCRYLFNSYKYGRGNEPLLHVAAVAQPVELKILSGTLTKGVFGLTALGAANLTYEIQANPNLATTSWLTIVTVSADAGGGTGAGNQRVSRTRSVNSAWCS